MVERQRSKLHLESQIIQAGAGAGKTHGLIETITSMMRAVPQASGEKIFPQVTITTFTRKATQEIRERLLKKAIELESLGQPEGALLMEFVTSSGALHISTIHGVFHNFLKRYGKNLGLDPQFEFIAGKSADMIKKEALKKLLYGNSEFSELLNSFSLAHILKYFEFLHVFSREYEGLEGITLTELMQFVQVKAIEARDHLRFILENPPDKLTPAFEPYFQILQEMYLEIESLDFTTPEGLQGGIEKIQIVSQKFSKQQAGPKNWVASESFAMFKEILKSLRFDSFLSPQFLLSYSASMERMDSLYKEYVQMVEVVKIKKGQLELADLETLTSRLLKDYPTSAQAFSEEFDFWFIDEFQDTSPIQVNILKQLVKDKSQYLVGDPQQSIYLFRGAREKVFEDAVQDFKQRNFKHSVWSINRRSAPETVYFINDLMTQIAADKFIAMDPWLEAHRPAHNPQQVVGEIMVVDAHEAQQALEAQAVCFRIGELLAEGVQPQDIAVLCRTNRQLSQIVGMSRKLHIPVQVMSGGRFFNRREILDAKSVLRFLFNPHDNTNTVALLRSPWFKIADKKLFSLKWRGSFWIEALKTLKDEGAISRLADYLKAFEQLGYCETLHKILLEQGVLHFSSYIDPSGRREAGLWKFLALVREAETAGPKALLKIFDEVEVSIEESLEGDAISVAHPNRVKMMTIHASKGLEFKHVIIPFLNQRPGGGTSASPIRVDEKSRKYFIPIPDEDGKNQYHPLAKDIGSEVNLQASNERLRLFYVAITRAKNTLSLIWTDSEKLGGMAERLSTILGADEGVHSSAGGKYRYQIRKGSFQPKSWKSGDSQISEKSLRSPYQAQVLEKQLVHTGVTNLLLPGAAASVMALSAEKTLKALQKARFGTEIHKLMESLKYRAFGDLKLQLEDKGMDRQLELAEFIWNSKELDLPQIIKSGQVEWGFSVRLENQVIEGQVDLWGRDSAGQFWVVDYKTGSSEFKDKALEQLKIYSWALAKCGKLQIGESINLAIIYPADKSIIKEKGPSPDLVEKSLRLALTL